MSTLGDWITAVQEELGLTREVDTTALLDLARDVAHGVARPAAPLTTFLVGLAAGAGGGDAEAVEAAVAKISALAASWESDQPRGESSRGEPS